MGLESIVVGADFSDESNLATEHALDIARHSGAKVTLVHVGALPGQPGGVPDSMQSTLQAYSKILEQHLSEDRDKLAEMRRRYGGQGVEVSHVVIDGYPDSGIVDAATELHAGLIVVGTHGRTGVKRFLLGSVAERVVRASPINVLVARGAAPTGGYHRIVVTTDFSDHSERAVEAALELAAPGARIDIIHCYQLPPMIGAAYAPIKAADDIYAPLRQSLATAAEQSGAELVAKYDRDDATMRFVAIEAPPAKGIQDYLDDGSFDLVVTGSHGRRGVRRFLLGSVSEATVRHAPCAALVVHAPASDA